MPVFQVAKEPGTREGTSFYHIGDGWQYHLNAGDELEGTLYFKCVYYERGCRGRASINPVDGFRHTQGHNHDADPLYPDEMALRYNILQRCKQLDYRSYHQIIAEESRRFDPEVAARVTFARMRTPMRNARLANCPQPPPQTLRDLTALLLNPQYQILTLTEDGEDNLYCGSVNDVDGGHHIVFLSERMLQRTKMFTNLHGDGTFRCVPVSDNFAAQIFCIVGVWRHHIIPLAWILMESMTEIAYTSVFQFLSNQLGDDIHLTKVITDFELAQQNAWAAVFRVILQGCLWHYARALLDKVVELNLLNRMRRIIEVKRIIRRCMALPLLPLDLILEGFRVIVQEARAEGLYIFRIVLPFLNYVWRYWVSREWMRQRICVYGSYQRTNNACECQNRLLRLAVGVHPNVYMFLSGILMLEQRSHNTILALEAGRRVTRGRRRTSIMNDNRIEELSEDLFNPPGPLPRSIFRFLNVASHLMGNLIDEALLARRQNQN